MTVKTFIAAGIGLLAISLWAGGCRRSEPAEDNLTPIESAEHFDRAVLKAEMPVLVDFHADWCPPCKELAPILNELAAEYKGKVFFVRVDTDALGSLAAQHQISALPTVVVFAGGAETDRLIGLQKAAKYRTVLDEALKKSPAVEKGLDAR